MAEKKFLDYSGVSYLWSKINEKVDAEATRAKAAEAANAAAATDAKDAADGVATLVGEIPSNYSEKTIVAYINKKAEETLDAATGSSGETAASVAKDLADYKDEVNPQLEDHKSRLDAIEGDYLVEADKTELSDSIFLLRTYVQSIYDDSDNKDLDSVIDLVNWVNTHGSEASDMADAIDTLEGKVSTIEGKFEGVGNKTISTYVSDTIDAKTGITGQTVKAYVDNTFATDDKLDAVLGTIPTGKTVVTLINESKTASTDYADDLFANINALSNTEIDTAIAAAGNA